MTRTMALSEMALRGTTTDVLLPQWPDAVTLAAPCCGVKQTQESSSLPPVWTASQHVLPLTSLHAGPAGGKVYTSSLDRTVKAWDAATGRLLLSVACPVFLRSVTTDAAETFLFAGGGSGVIFQVTQEAPSYVIESMTFDQ